MSRRIDIELTSARPDGMWTWRASGAREPKGVVGPTILPGDVKVGDVLRAEVEVELDGTTVLNTSPVKAKTTKSGLLEILPSSKPFEAVTSQLARRERNDRNERGDRSDRRDRPPRRTDGDRPARTDGDRRPARDPQHKESPARTEGADRRPRREGDRPVRTGEPTTGERRDRRPRPSFTPPPELPQRPKPKRLKPGRAYRTAVLAELPEAQRAVAERALQGGVPAVRQAVHEQNVRLKAEGKEEIPAAGLIQMAEQLLPKLRVAEWLDRATAAKADIADLALADLRSVVASSDDPVVARDETTRELAVYLKQALITKQETELALWLDDIAAALGVGRVIRALKLSSQPPKAGVPFPAELAGKLADAATASLTPDATPDRWAAVLEAAAFAPVRSLVKPTAPPTHLSDELGATVKRLAPALPQIAALFGVEVVAGTTMPKPMRPTRPASPVKKAASAKTVAAPKQFVPTPAVETPEVAVPEETPGDSVVDQTRAETDEIHSSQAEIDDVIEAADEASDKVIEPAAEVIEPTDEPADDATDDVIEPVHEAADEVIEPADDTTDEVIEPVVEAADKVIEPAAEVIEGD